MQPGFIRRSYLAKFAVALLVVVLLVGAGGVYAYTETADHLGEKARDEFTTIAEQDAADLAEWREERTVTARMLAMFDVVVAGNEDHIGLFLKSEIKRLPDDVDAIHYVDLETQTVMASSEGPMTGKTLSQDEVPWAHAEVDYGGNGVYVSEVYKHGGNPTVAYVARIPRQHGDIDQNYALVLTTNLARVADDFSHPTIGSFTLVVNGDGMVVADERRTETFDQYTESGTSTVVSEGTSGRSGFLDESLKEEELYEDFVVAYAPVAGADWVVALHVPSARAFALQDTVTKTLMLMVGTAFVGLLFIGLTLGRDTVRGLNELSGKADALAAGNLDEDLESSREDEIGTLFRAFDGMRDSLQERIEEAEAERVAAQEAQSAAETERERAEAAAAETERFARRLESRAAEFSDVMAECAQGDLTQRLDDAADNEAMEQVAVSFNETIAEIERTVANVVAFADEVATASKRVREHALDVSATGQEVSGSVDQISSGASTQNDRLQSVSGDVDEMSATIEEVAASADQVAQTSQAAADAGSEGRDAAAEAVSELHDIRAQTEETAETVAALDEQMDRIGEIVDVITRIADQTNILALNARIEAARAGEAGDGFAVVSSEVKQLAEETQESAAEIESLIEDVQEQTASSVEEMAHIESRVREGVDTVEATQGALDSVVDRVEEADIGVQEISRAMDDQAASVGDIAATIDEIASISEETTSEAASVADAAEEQAATLSGVSEDASTLAGKAVDLQSTLEAFETAASPGGVDGATETANPEPVIGASRTEDPSASGSDSAALRTDGATPDSGESDSTDTEPTDTEPTDTQTDGGFEWASER